MRIVRIREKQYLIVRAYKKVAVIKIRFFWGKSGEDKIKEGMRREA